VEVEATFNILSWVIFGALAGWVASLLTGRNDQQGCLTNIIVGVIGAFLGGLLWSFIRGTDVLLGWNLGSFVIAVAGAVLLLAILRALGR
jgi:uncharacterized membrane protein YeaQ/YmgE (transglycosylase-associated protein family)